MKSRFVAVAALAAVTQFRVSAAVLMIAVVTVGAAGAQAPAPGDLDSSFGTGGKVTTDLDGNGGVGVDVVVQPDGKIVVLASTFRVGTAGDFALTRYNPDGTLDTSFGTNGLVFSDIGGNYDDPSTLLLQPDGKLVAVGSSLTNTRYFSLSRYNPDGSPDTSFGTGGVVLDTNVGDFVHDAALQSDGKIVVAGGGFTGDFHVARYNADGSLDAGFGSSGGLVIDAGGPFDQARGIAVDSSGRIAVVGIRGLSSAGDWDIYLTRLMPAGAVDSSFGTNGIVTTDVAGNMDYPDGVAVQPDGQIVVVGQTAAGFGFEGFAARYSSGGGLDGGFGSGGIVATSLSAGFIDVAVQSNAKLVAGGFVYSGGGDFAVARYSPEGVLDAGFGSGGVVSTDFAGRGDFLNALALQPDGKIVAAGAAQLAFFGPGSVALVRYLGDPPSIPVSIDIKPGTNRNPVNLRSKGVIRVAILTTADFDASTVDPDSVRFGPAGAIEAHGRGHAEDVGDDGDLDLLFHFRIRDTGIALGDVQACLMGQTFDGTAIEGCDAVRVR